MASTTTVTTTAAATATRTATADATTAATAAATTAATSAATASTVTISVATRDGPKRLRLATGTPQCASKKHGHEKRGESSMTLRAGLFAGLIFCTALKPHARFVPNPAYSSLIILITRKGRAAGAERFAAEVLLFLGPAWFFFQSK